MTTVAVGVLDRDSWGANTDILVLVDERRRRLTWVPRDLWSPPIRHRINKAFALGGNELLLRCLAERGFACDGALTVRRSATEAALAGAVVTVPVPERLDFWYPAEPTKPIEEGRKAIAFLPPEETLAGERLHQWIGARTMIHRGGSDLLRCDRQQVFLRALLGQGFDFGRVLEDADLWRAAGADPFPVLKAVSAGWSMRTFRSVRGTTIDGKSVLLKMGRPERLLRRATRAVRSVTTRLGA
jgi:hypothetical protein